MRIRLSAVVAALSLTACTATSQGGTALSEAERAALADSLKQFAGRMVETIDRHDVEGFIGYHAKTPEVAWAMSGGIITVDSMRKSMLGYFPSPAGKNVHFTLGDARAYVMDRNAGVVTAIINSTNVDSTGATRTAHQAWSIAVHRIGGEWKVVQVHESYPQRD